MKVSVTYCKTRESETTDIKTRPFYEILRELFL